MGISGAKMLATNVVIEEDMLRQRRKLITVGSRTKNQIAGIYKKGELPMLQRTHPLATLYMQDAHEKCHEGLLTMLHRSRKSAWIIHGHHLVEAIKTSCTEFRLKEKRCMEQRMGPLPNHRVGPSPIFQSIAMDLFGLIEYQGVVNERQVGKGWGAIFVCTAACGVHRQVLNGQLLDGLALIHVCTGRAIDDSI